MINFSKITGFEWDDGNSNKNWTKHNVSQEECEETFLDVDLKQYKDIIHSKNEERFIILGKTYSGRILYIAFMIRKEKIRIISARNLNKKEVFLYES